MSQDTTWVKQFGGSQNEEAKCVLTDSAGNLLLLLTSYGSIYPDPTDSISTIGSPGTNNLILEKLDSAGNFIWARCISGAGDMYSFSSMVIDPAGNVLIVGYFRGTVDFDPGSPVFNLTSNGDLDIYVLKLNSAGVFDWVKQIGGMGTEYATSVDLDSASNIYFTGYVYSTADFDPGSGIYNLPVSGSVTGYVCKLDLNGNFNWAVPIDAYGNILKITPEGNIVLVGSFNSSTTFSLPSGTTTYYTNGIQDLFICQLNSVGALQWAGHLGGPYDDRAYGMKIDAAGNIYITGWTEGQTDFDPGAGIHVIPGSAPNLDAYICKLTENGDFIWATRFDGPGSSSGNSVDVDSSGNIYITGDFWGDMSLGTISSSPDLVCPAGSNVYVAKLDSNATLLWAMQMGSEDGQDEGNVLTYTHSGFVYVTGKFSDEADFNPSTNFYNLNSHGGGDVFLQKITSAGVGVTAETPLRVSHVFPNPTTGLFTVAMPPSSKASIFDLMGGRVLELLPEDNKANVDLSNARRGIYILQVGYPDGTKSYKRILLR